MKKTDTELAIIQEIENKIFVIRDQRVMLDSDLAVVYQVETLDETRHPESLRRQFITLDESGAVTNSCI